MDAFHTRTVSFAAFAIGGLMLLADGMAAAKTPPPIPLCVNYAGSRTSCRSSLSVLVLPAWLPSSGHSVTAWFSAELNNPFFGGSEYFFLAGVNSAPNTDYAYWVSQNVYAMYQLMFAIITPALIIGAIAERMKYWSLLVFMACWMFLVYFPLAHMVWGITGFMNGIWNPTSAIKAIDFAGGTVVHMTSGWSALILCLILGPRLGFKKEPMPPHSMVLCMVGTACSGWAGTVSMREARWRRT